MYKRHSIEIGYPIKTPVMELGHMDGLGGSKGDFLTMRIVVLSDSHGNNAEVLKIVEKHLSEAEAYFFLGDGDGDLAGAVSAHPDATIYAVRGNNDYFSVQPTSRIADLGVAKIYMTHGHLFPYHSYADRVYKETVANGAKIGLFGHTHVPYFEYRDGVYIINPGSIYHPRSGSRRGYAVVDITQAGIVPVRMEV